MVNQWTLTRRRHPYPKIWIWYRDDDTGLTARKWRGKWVAYEDISGKAIYSKDNHRLQPSPTLRGLLAMIAVAAEVDLKV